jgi:hypothetical protein
MFRAALRFIKAQITAQMVGSVCFSLLRQAAAIFSS